MGKQDSDFLNVHNNSAKSETCQCYLPKCRQSIIFLTNLQDFSPWVRKCGEGAGRQWRWERDKGSQKCKWEPESQLVRNADRTFLSKCFLWSLWPPNKTVRYYQLGSHVAWGASIVQGQGNADMGVARWASWFHAVAVDGSAVGFVGMDFNLLAHLFSSHLPNVCPMLGTLLHTLDGANMKETWFSH